MGWDHGIGAGSHDDVLCGVANAVDLDDAEPRELAAAAQELNALARQPALLFGVGIVRDHDCDTRSHVSSGCADWRSG
jgi:hypothetical protein